MRNTITKTVSMMLVTVMVLGIAVMPMRASAGQAEIINLSQPALEQIAKLNDVWVSNDEEAKEVLKSLFLVYDTDMSVSFISESDLEGVAKELSSNGISAVFRSYTWGGESVWFLECDSIESFPVNIYGLYAPGGRVIGCKSGEDDDSAATTSRPSYTAPSADVDIDYTQIFDASTNTWVDVQINQFDQSVTTNTTNNNHYWDVDNRQFWDVENNTYTTYSSLTYNPITQTYYVQFTDNRSYTYNFYYDYTYITYIGSSAEYREVYKVYYELPDGRSSGDLTIDELKGLSLQFDMVNYDKVASDTLTRVLLPFDGDLESNAFYDSTSSLTASAPYSFLESPEPFGGSLYIGSSSSAWTFSSVLAEPLSRGNGDGFTLQGRFYINEAGESDCFFYLYGDFWIPVVYEEPDEDNDTWYHYAYLGKNPVGGFYVGVQDGALIVYSTNVNPNDYQFTDVKSTYFSKTIASGLSPGVWYDFAVSVDLSSFSPVPSPISSHSQNYLYWLPGYVNNYYVTAAQANARFNQYACSIFFYLNGNKVGQMGNSSPYTGLLGFNYDGSEGGVFSGSSFSYEKTAFICSSLSGFQIQCRYANQSPMEFDNFRLVSAPLYSTDSYVVPQAPFDTNLVYVLPSVAGLNDNTVAIMSQLPVSGYRVGGIRPTDPTLEAGYVYMHIDGEFVDSVQQYNGSYWEEVTARLYTGIRWIPVTAFNVFTLEDMFDIIDPDADGSGDTVSDIYQYYLWWSGEWGTFQTWLQGTMQTLIEAIQASNGGGSSDAPVVIVPGYNDQTTTSEITTENPDGSTTVTTIVSNAAGLVYSNSVTTYPTDADGNTKTITVYTDSSGVMYQTVTTVDKDGNVTVTEPTQATGTLGSILKMITSGVLSIAGTVIEGFVTIVVDGVKFIIEFADDLLSGIGTLLGNLVSALTDFGQSGQDNALLTEQEGSTPILTAIYDALPAELTATLNLAFIMALLFAVFRFIHF